MSSISSIFYFYPKRHDIDAYNKITSVVGSRYLHKVHLKDFWANIVDVNEIKKKMHSRLPLNITRACNIFQVLDQMEEETNVM